MLYICQNRYNLINIHQNSSNHGHTKENHSDRSSLRRYRFRYQKCSIYAGSYCSLAAYNLDSLLNVGTTIAMATIPIELSKGKVISPLFIFDGKYRKFMGEYFTLIGLMYLAIIPALFFMIVPGIIISIGWSLAIYILLDKGVAPGEAMIQSNKATYGYKWTIFGVSFLLVLVFYILLWIINAIASGGFAMLLLFIVSIVYTVAALGCSAVIYRNLTAEPKPETMETVVEV